MALLDLYNREVRIGDRVVVGKDWARDCDYLVTGIVKNELMRNKDRILPFFIHSASPKIIPFFIIIRLIDYYTSVYY